MIEKPLSRRLKIRSVAPKSAHPNTINYSRIFPNGFIFPEGIQAIGKDFHTTSILLDGGASKSIVDLTGTIGYAFTDHILVVAGYRFLKVDYKKASFVWNMKY